MVSFSGYKSPLAYRIRKISGDLSWHNIGSHRDRSFTRSSIVQYGIVLKKRGGKGLVVHLIVYLDP